MIRWSIDPVRSVVADAVWRDDAVDRGLERVAGHARRPRPSVRHRPARGGMPAETPITVLGGWLGVVRRRAAGALVESLIDALARRPALRDDAATKARRRRHHGTGKQLLSPGRHDGRDR